ncbi:Histidine kinase [Abeliophyllum distichum]|uniref:Histidine kinase n=1 Tax=Abeliophyllum distichum TaxID=126358 RepID=A0ABD1RW29_9LAMI
MSSQKSSGLTEQHLRQTRQTPFSMAYRTEAVIPTEKEMPSQRYLHFDKVINEDLHKVSLNLQEERHANSQFRLAIYQRKMAKYYNSKVSNKIFKINDWVKNKIFITKREIKAGTLGLTWEEPYKVIEVILPGTYKLENSNEKKRGTHGTSHISTYITSSCPVGFSLLLSIFFWACKEGENLELLNLKSPVPKMSSTNINVSNNDGLGEMHVKLEPDWIGRSMQQQYPKSDLAPYQGSNRIIMRHESEEIRISRALSTPYSGTSVLDPEPSPDDDSGLCSTSPICPAPLCRQFWQAGNYDDRLASKSTLQNGTSYLRIHPKFLHSNATSHKWAFGAIAELLDNAIDEIQNGATFVIIDKALNPRDGNPALLIQDDGGGMDPEAMRRCLSFGFSDKNSKTAIGQYGNGFKTSSMRLGADVVVFSRRTKNRKLTQSVGLLSYTFLMQAKYDRIVVPMVDYEFNTQTGTWNSLHSEQHLKNNLSILLQWSPYSTEAELLKQCDNVGHHGTKILVYNLWHNDEGKMELDFETDHEDIRISGKANSTEKVGTRKAINEQHLANRLPYSLRAYLSVLYLRVPENFCILLRGRVVEYHNIAKDLKFPEFILYKPQNVEGSVITTVGFLKEAPHVNIHGFNVYHKNRLILPFWHVVSYSDSRGKGVVGVLEANFIEPTHSKQDFEKTPVFQKLETRLKEMTQEYWDYHCGLIGYHQVRKKPPATMTSHGSFYSRQDHGIFQPVLLSRDSGAFHQNSQGAPLKRKERDHTVEPERVKRKGVFRTTATAHRQDVKHAVGPANQTGDQEAANIMQDNQTLRARCQEYGKREEELNLKVNRLRMEIKEAQLEYARLLLESKLLEKVKRENKAGT